MKHSFYVTPSAISDKVYFVTMVRFGHPDARKLSAAITVQPKNNLVSYSPYFEVTSKKYNDDFVELFRGFVEDLRAGGTELRPGEHEVDLPGWD